MTEQSVIILKRAPGPVAGTSIVTVDAPNFTQAEFVVDTRLEDTAEEQMVLKKMLATRAQAAEAAKVDQV